VLANADEDSANWLTYGRTYKEQRHSPLTQINEETVDRLGLVWSHDLGTMRGLEGTPLVVDGTLYATGAWSILYAFDAVTGEPLWTHDPKVPRGHARFACCDVVNRGPAFYRGKVYVGTLDGRLIAVNARTGELVWQTETTPEGKAYSITGAPRIANGRVLIGNGGAEFERQGPHRQRRRRVRRPRLRLRLRRRDRRARVAHVYGAGQPGRRTRIRAPGRRRRDLVW
jgi:glucose dehydrogenase